jgi:manganese/zinc/iron transport system permease protein
MEFSFINVIQMLSAEIVNYHWVVLMGAFVGTACGLLGMLLILRKMVLVGDAISHSLLPGIVIAFLITGSRGTIPMFIGAVCAGLLTNIIIDFIREHSRVKIDAAIGVTFSALFAIGVILMSLYADQVDLDADHVLYGEIGFVTLAPQLEFLGYTLMPVPVFRMLGVVVLVIIALYVAYKEWVVTSFDAGLAQSLGIPIRLMHYLLMILLSIVIVSAFEAVGAILVLAMLIFPGATALMLTDKLKHALLLVVVFAIMYSITGLLAALAWNSSISGAMALMAAIIFVFVWIISPHRGLIARWRAHRKPATIEEQ